MAGCGRYWLEVIKGNCTKREDASLKAAERKTDAMREKDFVVENYYRVSFIFTLKLYWMNSFMKTDLVKKKQSAKY